MSSNAPLSLQVRPGTGRLSRTAAGVLFTPAASDGWQELLSAVSMATEDGLEPVIRALVGRGLAAPAFVYVCWTPRPAVLVFGEVELRTDHPSLPMLTGRGSETWVEHSLAVLEGEVALTVVPPEEGEEDTDLVAGTVPAAGFRLTISIGAASGVRVDVAAAPPQETLDPTRVVLPDPGVQAGPPPAATRSDAAQPTPAPAPTPASTPASIPASIPASTPASTPASIPESNPTPDQNAVPAPSAVDGPPLVDALLCPVGHSTPPGTASCQTCHTPVSPDAERRTVPQPPRGRLVLADGTSTTLDGDLLIGRRPKPGDDRRILAIDSNEVSREHARVLLRGWEVLIEDLESRNGTYVVPAGAQEPVRVDPEVPVRLDPDAEIFLGTVHLTYRVGGG